MTKKKAKPDLVPKRPVTVTLNVVTGIHLELLNDEEWWSGKLDMRVTRAQADVIRPQDAAPNQDPCK